MANEFYISAGLVPIDNSTGATTNSFYISAGLVPDDTASGTTYTPSTGSLAYTGYEPTYAINVVREVSTGSLAYTGYEPTYIFNEVYTAGVGGTTYSGKSVLINGEIVSQAVRLSSFGLGIGIRLR